MEVWGLGSRTIVNSVWQLLFRPGYFISDYISGKRQLSFPPMKMLFILAVAYAVVFHWLFPELKGLGYGMDFSELGFTADEGRNMTRMSQPFYDWYETHFGWSMMILSFIVIFPTWVMFHYSPRHTRHSLPEGFFIQVLFTDLQLGLFLLMVTCWFLFKQMTILSLFFIVVVAYFIIGYKQLFGYGLWGTMWRLVFVFCFVYSVTLLLGHLIFFSGEAPDIQVAGYTFPAKNFMPCFYVIIGTLVLSTGYLINRLVTPKAQRQQ